MQTFAIQTVYRKRDISMKKILIILALLMSLLVPPAIASVAPTTYTPFYHLGKPGLGSTSWNRVINNNFDLLDSGLNTAITTEAAARATYDAYLYQQILLKYGDLVARMGSLPEMYAVCGTFNGPTGISIALPKVAGAANEYAVIVEPTTRNNEIGDIWVWQGSDNATIYCSASNVGDTFTAVVIYASDTSPYGSSIHRKWYVSPIDVITDHCNAASVGSLAWVVAQVDGYYAEVELPGNHEYAIDSNCTIPATVNLIRQEGARFAIATGKSLTVHNTSGPVSQWVVVTPTSGRLILGPKVTDVYTDWFETNVTPGTTNMKTAIDTAKSSSDGNSTIRFTRSEYGVALPLTFTSRVNLKGEPGTRISLTAPGDHVLKIDGNSTGDGGNIHGSQLDDLILDGKGHAVDGFYLRASVSGVANNIRATNVTRAGFHGDWFQLWKIDNFATSSNIEPFSLSTPENGILIDSATSSSSSSGSTFTHTSIEHVSGSGIKIISGINNVFTHGTTEGNAIGIECGDNGTPTDSGYYCLSNTFTGFDIEVNSVADIVLWDTAYNNDFFSVKSGYRDPVPLGRPQVQIKGGDSNHFFGGLYGSIVIDENSTFNGFYGISQYGQTETDNSTGTPVYTDYVSYVTDNAGANAHNTWDPIRDITFGTITPEQTYRRRDNHPLGVSDNATIRFDHSKTKYGVITLTTGVTTATVATPINPIDAELLTITIHNGSGNNAVTINWPSVFRGLGGWTCPKSTYSKTIQMIYDASYLLWYAIKEPNADQNGTYDL
jgi:hypothetical protein